MTSTSSKRRRLDTKSTQAPQEEVRAEGPDPTVNPVKETAAQIVTVEKPGPVKVRVPSFTRFSRGEWSVIKSFRKPGGGWYRPGDDFPGTYLQKQFEDVVEEQEVLDEKGNPVFIPELTKDGNLRFDEDGRAIVHKQVNAVTVRKPVLDEAGVQVELEVPIKTNRLRLHNEFRRNRIGPREHPWTLQRIDHNRMLEKLPPIERGPSEEAIEASKLPPRDEDGRFIKPRKTRKTEGSKSTSSKE